MKPVSSIPEWIQNVLDDVVLIAPTRHFFHNGSEHQVAEVGIVASAAGTRSQTREALEVLGKELVRVVSRAVFGVHPSEALRASGSKSPELWFRR